MAYTYIGPSDFDLEDVAINARASLDSAGFVQKPSISGKPLGSTNVLDIVYRGAYGGVLIWVSHGGVIPATGEGWVEVETFPHTTAGRNDAYARIPFLVSGGYFTADELGVVESLEPWGTWHWALALVGTGISNNFAGDNAIAAIAACNSNSTASYWGSRVTVGYTPKTTNVEAAADMTLLFRNLTAAGHTDYSKMTVTSALSGTAMTIGSGDGETALFPWVTSVSPDPAQDWFGGETMVTVDFGTAMAPSPSTPFYVGGFGVVRNVNEWVSATQARVNVYSGWTYGGILVGLAADVISGSQGVPLLGGQDYYSMYYSATNSYPPAASVNAFIPVWEENGVRIHVDLASMRGTETLWVEQVGSGTIVDSIRAEDMTGHTFEVFDPSGRANDVYRLVEREYDGDVFTRATERTVASMPRIVNEATRLDDRSMTGSLRAANGVATDFAGPHDGIIICPDSFATNAQILANYWSGKGRPVKVVPLSASGSSRESIKAAIAQEYSSGVRYVLLAGTASDYEWFDDPARWPDLPGTDDWYFWWQDYHTPGGYYY